MNNSRTLYQILCLSLLIASAGFAGPAEDEKRDILLTDLPSDVLRLFGQYLGTAENHYNYCQAAPKVFSGNPAQGQILRDRDKLRHRVQTETGAVFTRISHHPKLGEAWKVHGNIFWGDPLAKDSYLWLTTFDKAYDYCMELNGNERNSVEASYQKREKALEDLRVQLANAPNQTDTKLEETLRLESEKLAPLSGCYPPNREEAELFGMDTNRKPYLGIGRPEYIPNSEIVPLWVDDHGFWAGSSTKPLGGAYYLSRMSGYIHQDPTYSKKPVRCMCRTKTPDMPVQEQKSESSWMDWFNLTNKSANKHD